MLTSLFVAHPLLTFFQLKLIHSDKKTSGGGDQRKVQQKPMSNLLWETFCLEKSIFVWRIYTYRANLNLISCLAREFFLHFYDSQKSNFAQFFILAPGNTGMTIFTENIRLFYPILPWKFKICSFECLCFVRVCKGNNRVFHRKSWNENSSLSSAPLLLPPQLV